MLRRAISKLGVALALVAVLAQYVVGAIPAEANYLCGINDPSGTSHHCYATALLDSTQSGAPVWGGLTKYILQPLATGDGHLSLEMWITGTAPAGFKCPTYNNYCWIEGGAAGGSNTAPINGCGTECYFWADVRPCPTCAIGSNYITHFVATPQSDEYGDYVSINIDHDQTSHWCIVMYAYHSGRYFGNNCSMYSSNNYMRSQSMQIGAELFGSYGASMNTTLFSNNQWEDVYHSYQHWNKFGIVQCDNPPINGHWATDPPTSQTGGDWQVDLYGTLSCP